MRIALGLEYNGSLFSGWQSQSNGRGVQDVLEHAIQQIAGHSIRVHAAGRTDTGVHALMQIIHFDTEASRPITAWTRGVNAFLPETVRVCWAKHVDEGFHARFSAVSRSYHYVLVNQTYAPAIQHDRVGWYHLPLDIAAMQSAISYLQGQHDFSAFRASECQAKSPIKTLHEASVQQHGQYIVFRFTANAFLHHQVRNMVGALIYVGNQHYPAKQMQVWLAKRNRKNVPPTFSPNGLYLSGVGYNAEWALPETSKTLIFM